MWYLVDGVLSFLAGAIVFYRFGKVAGVKAQELVHAASSFSQGMKQAGIDIKKGL